MDRLIDWIVFDSARAFYIESNWAARRTYLVHVLARLGRGLHVRHGPLLCPHLALVEWHLPFVI